MQFFTNKNTFKYAAWVALILGIILRGAVWLQQRSIFLDEANLIRNFVEKDYDELFGHLNYQQYAPPFFSVVVKFILQNFGINELTTKAFPLLCGTAMLPLFYTFGKRFLSPFSLFLAVLFISFGKVFIDYSTECKQYATDALIAVGLLLLAKTLDFKHFNRKTALLWGVVGSLSIWFSMPSVFILAGVGAYYFFIFFKDKNTKAMVEIVAVSSVWFFQFVIYFLLILKSDAASDNLQNFHKDYFFAFPPLSISDLNLLINQIAYIIDRFIGITYLAAICAIIGFSVGVRTLWRTNKAHFILLLVPILLTLIASALGYYSIITRLILFFMPSIILIIFIGLDHILHLKIRQRTLSKIHFSGSVLLVIGFIATIILQIQILNPFTPFRNDYSELRDGLDFIEKEIQPNEAVFAYYVASPVVRFYVQHRDKPYRFEHLILQDYICCDPNLIELDIKAIHQKGVKRLWVLYDLTDYSPLLEIITKQNGQILKKFEFHRGVALLYEIP